jgi:hypothetical protein
MPDENYYIAVKTRRDLKSYIENECDMASDDKHSITKRAIAQFAAECWRRHKELNYPLVLPTDKAQSYGIHVGYATRHEYKEFCAHQD